MIRDRRYKYIFYQTGGDVLFDLKNDPGEMMNLALRDGYGKIISAMRLRLAKYIDLKAIG